MSEPPSTPLVDLDPAVLQGELPLPCARELAVRRLFRLAVHDREHFRPLARDERWTELLSHLWGTPDIAVLQSMALLKPPGTVSVPARLRPPPPCAHGSWRPPSSHGACVDYRPRAAPRRAARRTPPRRRCRARAQVT